MPRESFRPCQTQARGAQVCGDVPEPGVHPGLPARFTRCVLLGGPDALGVSMHTDVCVCVCVCVCECMHTPGMSMPVPNSTHLDCRNHLPHPHLFF